MALLSPLLLKGKVTPKGWVPHVLNLSLCQHSTNTIVNTLAGKLSVFSPAFDLKKPGEERMDCSR